ncbi:hypothetical protein LX36DRAFT_611814 [Colletotrichum falcatum]|nr:hypothetical protein LX36DRAFT_611814 [Colletotrichum falcatum]
MPGLPVVPLSVESIVATPLVPIASRDESVTLQIKTTSSIWPGTGATGVSDGQYGSTKPVGFMLNKPSRMDITGTVVYPNTWPDKSLGKCILLGSVQYDATKVDVLKGSWTEELLVDKAPRQAPVSASYKCSLEMIEPLGGGENIPKVPWGFFGDVEWRLETERQPAQRLLCLTKTRLEIYRLPGIALGGPTEAGDWEAARPNLRGKWPVNLLRLFMPNPTDLAGQAARLQASVVSWWSELCFGKIISRGLQYDAAEGRSGYGVGFLGGSLDINTFYDNINPTINSFDIATLAEASFNILLPSYDPKEMPRIAWVGVTPVGSIAEKTVASMVPMGWKGDGAATDGVSTPFFKGILAQSEAAGRLLATAWLEIQTDPAKPALVVQAAFETKAKGEAQWAPDAANILRGDFLKRHFKEVKALTDKQELYHTTSSLSLVLDADLSGNDLYRKAGLYNLRGVNEPWPWRYRVIKPSILPTAPSLLVLIGSILNAGDHKNAANAASASRLINSGSLRPSRIYPLLKTGLKIQPREYNGGSDYFRLVVGRGVTVATYVVPLGQSGAVPNLEARIKISTLETFSDAIQALISELTGFESDIDKVILANDAKKTCGDYMIQTTQSLFLVRNNLLVDLTILGLGGCGNPAAPAALLAHARVLDAYLAANGTLACQARRAAFTVAAVPDDSVAVDQSFSITLGNVDGLAEEMDVHVSAGQSIAAQPIISTRVGPLLTDATMALSTRRLSFYVLQKDREDLSLGVDIVMTGAHYDTFYPSSKATRVFIR